MTSIFRVLTLGGMATTNRNITNLLSNIAFAQSQGESMFSVFASSGYSLDTKQHPFAVDASTGGYRMFATCMYDADGDVTIEVVPGDIARVFATKAEATNDCPACGASDCTPDTCPGIVEWHRKAVSV